MTSENHPARTSCDDHVMLAGTENCFYKNQSASKSSIPDITADVPLINPTDQALKGQKETERYSSDAEGEKSRKLGDSWKKNDSKTNQYPDNTYKYKVQNYTDERLVQDVSSTDVLTPLDDDLVGEVQEIKDRGNWSGRFDFLMSLLGYSVGLGNVWRFPYLAYSNGGGAFVFPFILMLLLLGIPLMFMELAMGQYAALGPAVIFDKLCPLFHGLGYGMIMVSALVVIYYTVIISWCILYLFLSITIELPWETCRPEWATPYCYSYKDADACQAINGSVFYDNTCYNASSAVTLNLKDLIANHSEKHPPAQDYFEADVLKMTDGIENMGMVQWKIALCLLLAWAMTFAALSKGVKSTGKVVYFTALFPYVVLCILFFRGVTLPGAGDGIIYYLVPRFDKLADAKVWSDAAAQIFFALSPAWGGLITLSSYNKFDNNCLKDALIVSIGNICTSIFAGFVIFSIIGYLALELEMPVDKVVDQGAGLAFIVYPDVVTRLPISPLWSILFFVMMITLGMGSEFALLETVLTGIQDTYPQLRKYKTWVVLVVSILGFFCGLALTTQGGMFLLQLLDSYVSSWCVFLMAAWECVVVGWIYGGEKFLQDVELMIGKRSRKFHIFFSTFWKFLSPLTLMAVLIFNLIQYRPLSYNEYEYPVWANILGWILSGIPLVFIIGMMIYQIQNSAPKDMVLIEKLKFLLKPRMEWGPASKVPKQEEDVVEDVY